MFWLYILAALCGAVLGAVLTYIFVTQDKEAFAPPSVGDVSPFESNVILMVRALIEEWDTHKKKRSGLVERDGKTEFILTIRRPLDVKKEEPVYVNETETTVDQ